MRETGAEVISAIALMTSMRGTGAEVISAIALLGAAARAAERRHYNQPCSFTFCAHRDRIDLGGLP
jgi:hypothetical protein